MQGLLIANENLEARNRLAASFAETDYQVTTAGSVVNELEAILNQTIQVIILAGDYDDQHIAKLVPLLKKCNRHISIIMVSDEIPLNLLRKIRKEGIFYHALNPIGEAGHKEIQQAVSCAFRTYAANINAPQTKNKERKMLNTKAFLGTFSLILLAVPALAADTTKVYTSGILVLLFVGFCALLVVAQLLPAILSLLGMTKSAAKNAASKKLQTAGAKKHG